MDKPECRLCGHKHWSNEAHVFKDSEVGSDEAQGATVGAPSREATPPSVLETGQAARNRRWREKNREKYNAYMRRYREKAKEPGSEE